MAESLGVLEKILFLKRVHIFSRLSARDLYVLAQEAREVSYEAGVCIFREGEDGDALYVIVSGQASVTVGPRVVSILGEKDCFGEIAVLTHEPRTATVTARSALVVLRIRRTDFRTILVAHPHIAFAIFEILATRLKTTNRMVAEMPLRDKG